MASSAEVCSAEAVVDSNRAAVTTLVFKEIGAMLGTNLEREREGERGRPGLVRILAHTVCTLTCACPLVFEHCGQTSSVGS